MHMFKRHEIAAPRPIRLVVGEDQPLMRRAMAGEFGSYSGVEVVGAAGTIAELHESLGGTEADMLVMEMMLGGQYASIFLQHYLHQHPGTRVLVVCGRSTEFHRSLSRKAGAHGFLSKQATPEELRQAFWSVARGGEVWPRGIAGALDVGERLSIERESRFQTLTVREMEVFGCIGSWKCTEEIAETLGISPKTVEIHRIHIKHKLKFNSASGLLRYAVERIRMEWAFVETPVGGAWMTDGARKECHVGALS